MIPLPPQRTKGGVLLGAAGPGDKGPFGPWGGTDTEPEADHAEPDGPTAPPGPPPPPTCACSAAPPSTHEVQMYTGTHSGTKNDTY